MIIISAERYFPLVYRIVFSSLKDLNEIVIITI